MLATTLNQIYNLIQFQELGYFNQMSSNVIDSEIQPNINKEIHSA